MSNPFVHLELSTSDVSKAKAFYTGLFGWEITDNEVRWNHGVGIAIPPGSETMRNFVHHNGELGLGAGAGSGAFEDNEIAFNVWNGTDCNWECGGVKWAAVTEWFVTGNYVHGGHRDGCSSA